MEIWKFLAGLGLFLYGMNLTEHVLKKVSGRSFKVFLKKYTQSLFKSIAGGALITGLLQSSSVVALLVLAFVGAGIITFRNALGVILGSNLGTTFSNWIVVSLGFKLEIENYYLPVLAATALAMFFFQRQKKLYNLLRIFFAVSILFLGIDFMKIGAEKMVSPFDLSTFVQYHNLIFVLAGFIITTIIQSSSATIAITLTALHANAIPFNAALAIVIGSELGTTIKIVLAATKGSPDKKRVAWGNFTFNMITTVLSYAFLPWLILFIQNVVKISDPLIGLVFFQSLINLVSIIIFLPFINPFARWLEKRFQHELILETSLISDGLPIIPEVAVDSVAHETEKLLHKTAQFQQHVLGLDSSADETFFQSLTKPSGISEELYERLKKIEGEILVYCSNIQPEDLDREQQTQISQYLSAVRQAIHSAKALKDIQHNLKQFINTGNDVLHEQYHHIQKEWNLFDRSFKQLLLVQDVSKLSDELTKAMKAAFKIQHSNNNNFIVELKEKHVTEVETSTMMNVQLEVLSAKKALLRSLAHLRLNPEQADTFEFLPEY